jgi:hypothetical protein
VGKTQGKLLQPGLIKSGFLWDLIDLIGLSHGFNHNSFGPWLSFRV